MFGLATLLAVSCLSRRTCQLLALATLPESCAGRSLKLQVIMVVMMLIFLIGGGANDIMLDLWDKIDSLSQFDNRIVKYIECSSFAPTRFQHGHWPLPIPNVTMDVDNFVICLKLHT